MRSRGTQPVVRSFQCASCGGPLTLRAPGQSKTIACPACGALVDAADPQHKLLKA